MKKTQFPDPPPEHLSERSKALWQALAPDHARSLQRRTLFQVGLEALDRADEARVIIETEGLVSTTATTGVPHINPLVRIEREARAQFVKIWGLLHLEWDQQIDGR
jgi:phage terminase small subunit